MIHNLSKGALVVLASVVSGLIACSGDTNGTAPATTTTLFSIHLNQHAINMSVSPPANTMQLTATPLNSDGQPLPGVGQITFSTLDTSVTVSASGLVTAHYATSTGPTKVAATIVLGAVTRSDTALIRVTPTAPPAAIETFSIQPTAGDSARRPLKGTSTIFGPDTYTPTVTATDINGQAIPFSASTGSGNLYWLTTGNNIIASNVNGTNYFTLDDTGHVTFYATSWVYGTAVTDSLKFLVGWPTFFFVQINQDADAFGGIRIFINKGGEVAWYCEQSFAAINIIFDDSTAVDSVDDENLVGGYSGSGNVRFPANSSFLAAARVFPVPGIYHFHSEDDPTQTGAVYVEPSLTP